MNILLTGIRWLLGISLALFSAALLFGDQTAAGLLLLFAALAAWPPSSHALSSIVPFFGGHIRPLASAVFLFFGAIIASITNVDTPKLASANPPLNSKQANVPDVTPASKNMAKISPDAIFAIEGEGWEETRRKWGQKGIDRINASMGDAAEIAARSNECDYVEIVGYDDQKSDPKKDVVYWVDCKNKKRFYVTETDIAARSEVTSIQNKMARVTDAEATIACERSVKKQISYPLSFKRHTFSRSVRRHDNGAITLTFTFDAKNGFGNELPHRAVCFIDEDGLQSAEITQN